MAPKAKQPTPKRTPTAQPLKTQTSIKATPPVQRQLSRTPSKAGAAKLTKQASTNRAPPNASTNRALNKTPSKRTTGTPKTPPNASTNRATLNNQASTKRAPPASTLQRAAVTQSQSSSGASQGSFVLTQAIKDKFRAEEFKNKCYTNYLACKTNARATVYATEASVSEDFRKSIGAIQNYVAGMSSNCNFDVKLPSESIADYQNLTDLWLKLLSNAPNDGAKLDKFCNLHAIIKNPTALNAAVASVTGSAPNQHSNRNDISNSNVASAKEAHAAAGRPTTAPSGARGAAAGRPVTGAVNRQGSLSKQPAGAAAAKGAVKRQGSLGKQPAGAAAAKAGAAAAAGKTQAKPVTKAKPPVKPPVKTKQAKAPAAGKKK